MRFPPVMSRSAAGEVRLSEQLSQSARLRLRPAWRRGARSTPRSAASMPAATGRRAAADRSRALAGGLLSGLSDGGGRGAAAAGGLQFDVAADCFRREATFAARPAAVVPDARIRLHRHARTMPSAFPRTLDGARARRSPTSSALPYRIDAGERSVLRPRRPDDGGQPDAAVAEIRAADSAALGRSSPTACMSFNYHRDHFGDAWDLHDSERRTRPYRLRGVRHGPARGRAVRNPRHQGVRLAAGRAQNARDVACAASRAGTVGTRGHARALHTLRRYHLRRGFVGCAKAATDCQLSAMTLLRRAHLPRTNGAHASLCAPYGL